MRSVRIGIIADYNPKNRYHLATENSVTHAAHSLELQAESVWLDTDKLLDADAEEKLRACDALWCGPSSPYRSLEGALHAIQFAREKGRPFVGTWGGFQHTLLEYARNILGMREADHQESSPDASFPLISKLSCSLVGQTGTVTLVEGSISARIYGQKEVDEEFACNYGLNEQYQDEIYRSGLLVSGFDAEKAVRIVELPDHPFYIATLFLPQMRSQPGKPHPLLVAYIKAAAAFAAQK